MCLLYILYKGACSGTGKEGLSHSAGKTDGSMCSYLSFFHFVTAPVTKVIFANALL